MLGKVYSSVEHLSVPRLIHLEHKGQVSKVGGTKGVELNLYRLDWETVDNFKGQTFLDWLQTRGVSNYVIPSTLPDQYDSIINGLIFALSHDYLAEIRHFSQLYYMERLRVRKFDTVIRDMCHGVAQAAINCAFKLLADCIYDRENQTWFREDSKIDKFAIKHLMMYKFWREHTGRALVWDHAEMGAMEELAAEFLKDAYRGPRKTGAIYHRIVSDLRQWEDEQEKLWEANKSSNDVSDEVPRDILVGTMEAHEEATVTTTAIRAKLRHLPFLPGTVVVTCSFKNSITLIVRFDHDGLAVLHKLSRDPDLDNLFVPDLANSKLTSDGELLLLASSVFPIGTIAQVSYEYPRDQEV